MIKIILIMVVAAAVLTVTDDLVRARWHQPEQPVQQIDRTHKGNRVHHLDFWLIDREAVKVWCVMSPCWKRSLFEAY